MWQLRYIKKSYTHIRSKLKGIKIRLSTQYLYKGRNRDELFPLDNISLDISL